jgi:hypothetical protein
MDERMRYVARLLGGRRWPWCAESSISLARPATSSLAGSRTAGSRGLDGSEPPALSARTIRILVHMIDMIPEPHRPGAQLKPHQRRFRRSAARKQTVLASTLMATSHSTAS